MLPRRRPELPAERVVERRDIAKSAAHGDVGDAGVVRREPYGGSAQPGAHHIAVRREPREARERAYEMKRAELRLARERVERQRLARIALDERNGTRDAAF